MEDNKMEFVPARASEIVRDYVAAAEKGEKPTKLQELMFSPAENVEHATERLGSTVEFIIDLYQAALLEAGIRAKDAAEFKAAFDRACADNSELAKDNLALRADKIGLSDDNKKLCAESEALKNKLAQSARNYFELIKAITELKKLNGVLAAKNRELRTEIERNPAAKLRRWLHGE